MDSQTILLVEGDDILAEVTSFRLELLGYRVQHEASAEAALAYIEQSPPGLIILDLYLPGLDGVELVNRLKADDSTTKIPLMVFSVDADLTVVERAFAAGADDYVVIPYDPAVLQEKVARLLEDTSAVSLAK